MHAWAGGRCIAAAQRRQLRIVQLLQGHNAAGPSPAQGPPCCSTKLPAHALLQAVRTAYAKQSGDYMAALAGVHCQRRGWQA